MENDGRDPDALWQLWAKAAPGVWDGYVPPEYEETLPIGKQNICECGAHKVYGVDCVASMHYDWCGLFKKEL